MKHSTWAALFTVLAPSACGSQPAAPSTPPAAAGASKPATGASPQANSPVTLKVGTQHVATDAPLYIAQDKGFFKEQGLDVQFTDINGEEAIAAVGTGQLDASVGAIYSGLLNAIARSVEIRLIATKGSIATQVDRSKPASALVITKKLADSGAIKDRQDLKGKKIAVASLGRTCSKRSA